MIYHFYQAGALPIIGGIFAGVAVEVDDAHTKIISVSPLSPQSSNIPAIEEIPPLDEENLESSKES